MEEFEETMVVVELEGGGLKIGGVWLEDLGEKDSWCEWKTGE